MTTDQLARIEWRDDGVPVSQQFDDPYFSLQGGLAESRHVFLTGNGLPDRFLPGFHIAELGFGTGLNLAAALSAWRQSGMTGPLRYTGFEAFPMTPDQMTRALAAFPEIEAETQDLPHLLTGRLESSDLIAELIIGDARTTLPQWSGRADAWFMDGFAPAKNPELWQPDLLNAVARHTAPAGTFATYTAAGFVRRSLVHAGFTVTRRPGFGRKRHMTTGVLTT